MDVTFKSALSKAMKEVYGPRLLSYNKTPTPLLEHINKRTADYPGGKTFKWSIKTAGNMSATSHAEGGAFAPPGQAKYEEVLIDYRNLSASFAITGNAKLDARGGNTAFIDALEEGFTDTKNSMELLWSHYVWGRQAADLGTITTLTGSGPWVFTLANASNTFMAQWVQPGMVIRTGPLTTVGGVVQVNSVPGDLIVTDVDPAAQTITCITGESGTPAPVNGHAIVRRQGENLGMNGVGEVFVDSDKPIQGLSRTAWRQWQTVRKAAGGAGVSLDLLQQFESQIAYNRADKGNPSLRLTTRGLSRKLYNLLTPQYQIQGRAEGDKILAAHAGYFRYNDCTTQVDSGCPTGSIFTFSPEDITRMDAEKGHWIEGNGGSNLNRWDAVDQEMGIWVERAGLAYDRLNTHGVLSGLADTDKF